MKTRFLFWILCISVATISCSSLNKTNTSSRNPSMTQEELNLKVQEIASETIGIDAHNHVDVPLELTQLPGPKVDMIGEFKKSGLSVIGMTFAVDYQKLTQDGQAYDRFLNGLNAMDVILKDNGIKRALNYQDIVWAHQQHHPIVIQSVEGGHFLEGRVERLKIAYDHGLRHLGILHDSDASVPLGDVYTNPPRWGGLTDFGKQVIQESERLGILVDLAHCDNQTVEMVLRITTKPIVISHTGLDTQLGSNPKMAQMMKPRLISKETARKVADAGGIICVWTHLADTPLEYAENIKAMVDVVGIDHVCLGTDTKLTTPFRATFSGFDGHPKTKNKSSAPPQGERIGERTNRAWKDQQVGYYYAVIDALLKVGFSDRDIAKIGGENYLRVFKAATEK